MNAGWQIVLLFLWLIWFATVGSAVLYLLVSGRWAWYRPLLLAIAMVVTLPFSCLIMPGPTDRFAGFLLRLGLLSAAISLVAVLPSLLRTHRHANSRCQACGYPNSGVYTATCPECGASW